MRSKVRGPEAGTGPVTPSKRQMEDRPECGCLHSPCPRFSGSLTLSDSLSRHKLGKGAHRAKSADKFTWRERPFFSFTFPFKR